MPDARLERILITNDDDLFFNAEGWLNDEVAREFSEKEGNAFLLGNGRGDGGTGYRRAGWRVASPAPGAGPAPQ